MPPQGKDKVKELEQQEIMFLTTQTMEAKYKDMPTPQDQYTDQLGALVTLTSTEPDPEPLSPGALATANPSLPDKHEHPLCQEMSFDTQVLLKLMKVNHPSGMIDSDTQPAPHLLLFDHYQQWLEAVYITAGEAESSTAQLLVHTRALALE